MTNLSNPKVTYSFKGDGVDAELDGKVIASGANVAEAETAAHKAMSEKTASRKTATHITTPNGLKGKVLGRTPSLWGEEVTVRFENGHISKLPTSRLSYSTEESSEDPLARIASILATPVQDEIHSLTARLDALQEIPRLAAKIASSLGHDGLVSLDQHVMTARAESLEIKEAIASKQDELAQEYEPYRPEARAYEESWLDRVAAEEVEAAQEEPLDTRVARFVTALSTDTLADGSLVAQIVYDKVSSESNDEEYIENFIEAAEQIRQTEHIARREATKQAHVASQQALSEATDEGLFW